MTKTLNNLAASEFSDFFQELYPYPPMDWQIELATAACSGQWPDFICLPTGAGKTSTIDIAVFALAVQASLKPQERTAPMRTFLIVDRRTVVSDAFYRATKLKERLESASTGVLKTVFDRLSSYTDGQPGSKPLAVVQMRGGIYRDRNWCNSLTQPMIVTSTVDQVGSRLLFRGYGVSNSARPMQAAAVATDSLIILDEAHISPAFSQTLKYVRDYQQSPWCEVASPKPLRVIEMTATPPADSNARKLEIAAAKLKDSSSHIGRIVNTAKPTTLVLADKVKGGKAPQQIAAVLVEQALRFINPSDIDNSTDVAADGSVVTKNTDALAVPVIGVMCNMVATAKHVFELLRKEKAISDEQVELIIGAMRPLDRETQTDKLRTLISTGASREAITNPLFVVATQCIEVGADYDFDFLVTEAAPLDSLVQRFGRLNRAGRDFPAAGFIVMRGDHLKTDQELDADEVVFSNVDPIYGNAKSYTWNWLMGISKNDSVDFGIAALKAQMASLSDVTRQKFSTGKSFAPVLLPAHLDMLCQTSVDPWPDPDVSLWLHGPQRNDPEVQICWRADLLSNVFRVGSSDDFTTVSFAAFQDSNRHAELVHSISLCPPTSAECISVPLRRVASWLKAIANKKKVSSDTSGDIPQLVEETELDQQSIPVPYRPVAWRGIEKSELIDGISDIRPGDTLVFSPLAGGWTELGFVPNFSDWSCRDENGKPLDHRLLEIAESGETVVRCHAEDFEKLSRIDVGSLAYRQSKNRSIVRLHPSLLSTTHRRLLAERLSESSGAVMRKKDLVEMLREFPSELTDGLTEVSTALLKVEYYFDPVGFVVTAPRFDEKFDFESVEDDGSDINSRIVAGEPIELADHLKRVRLETCRTSEAICFDSLLKTLSKAAEIHDWGKADPRFQAMLLGGDLHRALWEEKLYAKSAKMPVSLAEQNAALQLSKLPKQFRHEMLSLALAEKVFDRFDGVEDVELMLHLIASHHGHARPWVPFCDDTELPEVGLERIGLDSPVLTSDDRKGNEYYRVDSSVPKRFWFVVRKYGWWGAATLESVLRFADQRVSQIESNKQSAKVKKTEKVSATELEGAGV